jgi:hypothetical protein
MGEAKIGQFPSHLRMERTSSGNSPTQRVGVPQIAPSTPGVFLPLLCVTRFTANARPWNEWVSHCRAFTLP